MSDEIGRWSAELARDPASLIFLKLSDELRRTGQTDVALKIALRGLDRHAGNADAHDLVARIAVDRRDLLRALNEWETVLRLQPDHIGALRGLGYVCHSLGRAKDARQYLHMAEQAVHDRKDEGNMGRAIDRWSGGVHAKEVEQAEVAAGSAANPQFLFADLLLEEAQTALLLDGTGCVLAGLYLDGDGNDLSPDVGAQLSGISDEVLRATRHLGIGAWKSITFETHAAVVAMAPGAADSLIVVAASRATPLGFLRRLVERCGERAAEWLSRTEAVSR